MREKVNDLIKQGQPFVLFRLPGDDLIHCYYQKDLTANRTSTFTESGFVFAPFAQANRPLFMPDVHRLSFASPPPKKNVNTTTNLPQDQRKNFIEQVTRAVETIKGETFEKVVLSNAFTLQYTGETLEVFYRMVHQYSNAFVYYWFHPQTGTWLGATPERFLSLENEQLSTMALAGTLPTATATWSKKEIHEQQLVVASIQQGLSRYVPDHKIKIGERETVHAGELRHLCTHIQAEVSGISLALLVQKLHPTPAVGGLPKDIAVDYILAHENYDRAYYTGYLGPFSNGKQANLFVNLRCATVFDDTIRLFTGAGITAGSVPEREWEEICRKANTFLSVL